MTKREATEMLFSLPEGGIASCVAGVWSVVPGVTHWQWGASECVVHSPVQRRAFDAALTAVGVAARHHARAYRHFNAEYIDDICA